MRTAAKHAVSTNWMIRDRSGFRFTRSNQAAGSQKSDLGHVIAKRGAARRAERPAKRCMVALTGHGSILFR